MTRSAVPVWSLLVSACAFAVTAQTAAGAVAEAPRFNPPKQYYLALGVNLLEGFDLAAFGLSSADHPHVLAEAFKLAVADSSAYRGDPAFVDVPVQRLISKEYAARRRAEIQLDQAEVYDPGPPAAAAATGEMATVGGHTVHISVIDAGGNAVSLTCTLGRLFGSGVVVAKAGFLLGDRIFSTQPGHPNEAAGGKRSASTTSPTIVVADGIPILVIGSAGNEEIPRSIVSTIVHHLDFGLDIAHAVDAERFSCGNVSPDVCTLEDERIAAPVLAELTARGHDLADPWGQSSGVLGAVQVAGVDPVTRERVAASDSRREWGAAAAAPHWPATTTERG